MKFRVNIAIFGATGYTGLELIRLLNFHKKAEIKYLISNSNYGKKISPEQWFIELPVTEE